MDAKGLRRNTSMQNAMHNNMTHYSPLLPQHRSIFSPTHFMLAICFLLRFVRPSGFSFLVCRIHGASSIVLIETYAQEKRMDWKPR